MLAPRISHVARPAGRGRAAEPRPEPGSQPVGLAVAKRYGFAGPHGYVHARTDRHARADRRAVADTRRRLSAGLGSGPGRPGARPIP